MIQPESRLKVADNTGAKEIMCIRVVSGSAKRYATVGDIIKASVKQAAPNGQVKRVTWWMLLSCVSRRNMHVLMDRIFALTKTPPSFLRQVTIHVVRVSSDPWLAN